MCEREIEKIRAKENSSKIIVLFNAYTSRLNFANIRDKYSVREPEGRLRLFRNIDIGFLGSLPFSRDEGSSTL